MNYFQRKYCQCVGLNWWLERLTTKKTLPFQRICQWCLELLISEEEKISSMFSVDIFKVGDENVTKITVIWDINDRHDDSGDDIDKIVVMNILNIVRKNRRSDPHKNQHSKILLCNQSFPFQINYACRPRSWLTKVEVSFSRTFQ